MDLPYMTVKAAYYDMEPAVISEVLCGLRSVNYYEDKLKETIKWEEFAFTASDADKMLRLTKQNCNDSDNLKLLYLLPYLLSGYGEEVLTKTCDEPCVEYEQLLRWRRITRLIGEDGLVLPSLARRDMESRTIFRWPDTLGHNNERINYILNSELSDTHAHLMASADIFAINWLCLCNYPRMTGKDLFRSRQQYDIVPYIGNNYNLSDWLLLAVAIRVKIYEVFTLGCLSGNNLHCFAEASNNKLALRDVARNAVTTIDVLRQTAPRTTYGLTPDYAIDTLNATSSPYSILAGERRLLYIFFRKYFSGDKLAIAWEPYVYLYLLIKVKVRREMVQTNRLRGFANFKTYQDRKSTLYPKSVAAQYKELTTRYATQTACPSRKLWHAEMRVTPDALEKLSSNLFAPIFDSVIPPSSRDGRLTMVAHFIKKEDETSRVSIRYKRIRQNINRQLTRLLLHRRTSVIVGVDAAGAEIDCPPEVFGPFYRKARMEGIKGFTYHVGEDFHDVLSGLRAIDETIQFLDYTNGCRLGHALALGLDVHSYYRDRHNTIIAPGQTLLDDLVWLRYCAARYNIALSPYTVLMADEKATALLRSIGYDITDIHTYWLSMRLRGDWFEHRPVDDYIMHSKVYGKECECARPLLIQYLYDQQVRQTGRKIEVMKVEQPFVNDVSALQEQMLTKIESRGIVIESCPSSNLMIGISERYDELPVFRFHSILADTRGHAIPVSVNTDDRGVFATNIAAEYSLLSIAMHKKCDEEGNHIYNDTQIAEYIKKLVYYGNMSRFRRIEDIL